MTSRLAKLSSAWRNRAQEMERFAPGTAEAFRCAAEDLEAALGESGRGIGQGETDAARIDDYTVAQLAEDLGKAPSTITGWLQAGLIPEAYKLLGREWRVPRVAVRAFLDRQPKAAPVRKPSVPKPERMTGDLSRWRKENAKHRRSSAA